MLKTKCKTITSPKYKLKLDNVVYDQVLAAALTCIHTNNHSQHGMVQTDIRVQERGITATTTSGWNDRG